MFVTLYDLLKHCEKAIHIYNRVAEDNGMDGDIETFEIYEKKGKNLIKMINTIREQLETNKSLPISSYINWLNEPENESVKTIIYDALEIIKQDREYQIKGLQEDINFSNIFIEKNISDSFGGTYDY